VVSLDLNPTDVFAGQGDNTDLAQGEFAGEGRVLRIFVPAERLLDQLPHGGKGELAGKTVVGGPGRPQRELWEPCTKCPARGGHRSSFHPLSARTTPAR